MRCPNTASTSQAVVTIGAKDHYLGPHGTAVSHQAYDRLVMEFLASGRRLARPEALHQPTIDEILAAFWQHAKTWYVKNGQPTNELDAFRVLMRDVRALYGPTPAEEYGPLAFKAVRQRWIERGQARPTFNKNAGRLKPIFKWAANEELIPASVHQALTTVDGLRIGRSQCPEPDPVLPVGLHVVEQTIPHLPPVTRDMVRFQLLTGARPGEVCRLTPDDIDRSGEVWEARIIGHKTNVFSSK